MGLNKVNSSCVTHYNFHLYSFKTWKFLPNAKIMLILILLLFRYYKTNHLTIKSDIYSFSIVLLELICGCPSLGQDHGHIGKWVSSSIVFILFLITPIPFKLGCEDCNNLISLNTGPWSRNHQELPQHFTPNFPSLQQNSRIRLLLIITKTVVVNQFQSKFSNKSTHNILKFPYFLMTHRY
jgi:hypothetical protein